MRKTISVPLLAALLFGVAGTPSFAFNQPPLNLGLTDILDGAFPAPGPTSPSTSRRTRRTNSRTMTGTPSPGTRRSPTCFR